MSRDGSIALFTFRFLGSGCGTPGMVMRLQSKTCAETLKGLNDKFGVRQQDRV